MRAATIWRTALGLAAALGTAGTIAGAGADYYAGKQIALNVGFGAGGGYDLHARLVAQHFGRHVPGNPTIVVQNVPGAGGLRLANQMYNVNAGDATAIGMVAQAVATEQAIGGPGIQYDARRFNWIGRVAPNIAVSFTWHESPVKTMEDALAREAVLGGTGPGAASVVMPTMMNAALGTKFRLVRGYPSMAEAMVAMERGEVDGALLGWSALKSTQPEWVAKNRLNILVQHALNRHPELAHVPTTPELARNEEERQLLEFMVSSAELGFSIFLPPDVDAAHVETLRRAYEATVKDERFLADVEKRGIEISPMSGADLDALVKRAFEASPAVLAKAKEIYGR